jgi:hypothetical protein
MNVIYPAHGILSTFRVSIDLTKNSDVLSFNYIGNQIFAPLWTQEHAVRSWSRVSFEDRLRYNDAGFSLGVNTARLMPSPSVA